MPETHIRKKYIMVGSTPLSVSEVSMAPAIIGALIKNRGHDFEFFDINLELYDHLNDKKTYYNAIENFSDWNYIIDDDPAIKVWFDYVIKTIKLHDACILSVFSVESQFIAHAIARRLQNTSIPIFLGGVGSHKELVGSATSVVMNWATKNFTHLSDLIFGKLLLNNNLIDYWQSDVSTTELEKHVPDINPEKNNIEFDFSIYDLDRYYWVNEKTLPLLGSYGCVRQCEFCDVLKHFGKFKFVEADKLSNSIIQAYQTTGVSKFAFMDSLVNGSMSNFENLLRNLAHSKEQKWLPADFSWSGTYIIRQPSIMLDRIHSLLPLSGLDTLSIGVETGSDKVRYDMDKKFTNDHLLQELEAFDRYGVKAILLFFTGWPTETDEDFLELLNLFKKLSKYGQTGTVESVSFAVHGFGLIDGTPIDARKEEIGLEPGPFPNLWKCSTNPSLNLYEILRRRLLAIETAKFYGIDTGMDSEAKRRAVNRLLRQKDTILEYVGVLKNKNLLDFDSILASFNNEHQVVFEFSNKGTDLVQVKLSDDSNSKTIDCYPGNTKVDWQVKKTYANEYNLRIDIEFSEEYTPVLNQYKNGEYYSENGLYIARIQVDYKDITLWGFDQLTNQKVLSNQLPDDYGKNVNKKQIIYNTVLSWQVPAKSGLHTYIWEVTNPEITKESKALDKKLNSVLELFRQ